MSRTTTVDGAPASDTDKQSISQPNQFIKRGTPQFMRVTPWRCSLPDWQPSHFSIVCNLSFRCFRRSLA
ncbi:hypothetical protein KZ773_00205 [Escherichia coli]|nr:hypothetical protein [Escherichia coli]